MRAGAQENEEKEKKHAEFHTLLLGVRHFLLLSQNSKVSLHTHSSAHFWASGCTAFRQADITAKKNGKLTFSSSVLQVFCIQPAPIYFSVFLWVLNAFRPGIIVAFNGRVRKASVAG